MSDTKKELETPEFPGWNAVVSDSQLFGAGGEHVMLTLTTRIIKEDLAKYGPDLMDRIMGTLRKVFEEVPTTDFLKMLEQVGHDG